MAAKNTRRLEKVTLQDDAVVRRSPEVDHERRVAIFDLLEDNDFVLAEGQEGPYHLNIGLEENRLIFDIANVQDEQIAKVRLALTPFRGVVRDYFTVCGAYYDAIKWASPSRIETIDLGRRGLHNEGAELFKKHLAGKISVDSDTARRLFTLVCVLHVRG